LIEFLIEAIGLFLVFDERIALAVAAQADAATEIVDGFQMLDPELVDGADEDGLLDIDKRQASLGEAGGQGVIGGIGGRD